MNTYNLTDNQKQVIKYIVEEIEKNNLSEEFIVSWNFEGTKIFPGNGKERINLEKNSQINISRGVLEALKEAQMIVYTFVHNSQDHYRCTITGKAYDAVQSNFNEPDTSFIKYITPLADVNNLDNELKTRCLPILGAGSSDTTLWDSAVRTAGVILEERLRKKGSISDPNITGQGLVNKIFSKNGTLASKFTIDSERQGYRDLYAGIIGAYRNPSAHRLIDPTPEEGGAFIIFVDLLLKKLDNL